ncbi:MAG: oligosaccharide flippase family protein [Luteolibacter sp.]
MSSTDSDAPDQGAITRLLARAKLWLRLLSGKEEALTHSQQRNRRIGLGFLSSIVLKGTGFLVSIISVPLAIGYLGDERYGLWMAITSVIGWLALSDIGLSYSLSLALSHAFGRDDRQAACRAVSSGFFGLCIVSFALCVGFSIAAPWIPWDHLFKVHDPQTQAEILPTMILAFVLFVINFPLSIVGRVFNAYQEFVAGNIILITINLSTLAALVFATWVKAGLPVLVACYSGANVLVSIIAGFFLFRRHKPWLRPSLDQFDPNYAKRLMTQGIWYFLASISAVVNFQTDTMVISSFLNTSEVTPYSVSARLFSYAALITALVGGSLQPAYTEALARNDYGWIRKTLFRHCAASLVATSFVCAALFAFSNPIIAFWTKGEVHPTVGTLAWMALWGWLQANCLPVATLLNGLGKPIGMTIYGGATALLNLVLSIFLVKQRGVEGVVMASVISYVLINIPLCVVEVIYRLKRMHSTTAYE